MNRTLEEIALELAHVTRELARIRQEREDAVALLTDATGHLTRALGRQADLMREFDAYIVARAKGQVA